MCVARGGSVEAERVARPRAQRLRRRVLIARPGPPPPSRARASDHRVLLVQQRQAPVGEVRRDLEPEGGAGIDRGQGIEGERSLLAFSDRDRGREWRRDGSGGGSGGG